MINYVPIYVIAQEGMFFTGTTLTSLTQKKRTIEMLKQNRIGNLQIKSLEWQMYIMYI